jgi:predicted 3-demethylubiquinone-9 3-methyltransferase (glyoxalase superfamily)
MATVTPFLWFTEGAEEALAVYQRVFTDCETLSVNRSVVDGEELLFSAQLRIGTSEIILFNGGPYADYTFSPATSMFVTCEDQAEVDALWEGLSEGAGPGQCGWITDRFGVTWQIIPKLYNELMSSEDPALRDRVNAAMMKMTKFDCQGLLDAAAAG